MLNELVLATHNQGKVEEFRLLLGDFNIKLLSSCDFSLNEPEETEKTFEGNALLKARYTVKHTKKPSLADDSGLCIPCLGDFPGIYSARFAKECGGFPQAMEALRHKVCDVLGKNTKKTEAYFICVLALVFPDGRSQTFEGRIDGKITWPPYGEGGFGYDPIFIADGYEKSFAELSSDEKGKISHRARAVSLFLDALKTMVSL